MDNLRVGTLLIISAALDNGTSVAGEWVVDDKQLQSETHCESGVIEWAISNVTMERRLGWKAPTDKGSLGCVQFV